jgi:DNA/RNA endonuclease YhcR with UshA esterase domain
MRKALLWIFLIPLLCQPLIPQQKITAADAKNHIGEEATVCGNVASTRYASSTRGQPIFLNLEQPYPNQIFTVVILGRNRAKFGNPESEYSGKRICVTGKIEDYRGVAEIEAKVPGQIKIEK